MKYWGVVVLVLIMGCTGNPLLINSSSRFEYATVYITEPVRYTPTGINGFVKSNQELCRNENKVIVMLFGKADNAWTEEAIRILIEAVREYSPKFFIEQWISNVPAERQELFKAFNPTQSYPTVIVGCQYIKVGSSGDHDTNVKQLKQILELVV
jgi:hypothetical protein